jgi:protein-disulfide isomerase
MHIDGTPSFIVGDTMIPGADMNALRAAIAAARAGKPPATTRS